MSGIIILPIFIFYMIVGTIILRAILKKLNKNIAKKWIFLIVLLFPFTDLFVQKGVQIYYRTFLLDPIVYEMPERNENGKIESMDLTNYIETTEDILYKERLYTHNYKRVENYIEVSVNNNKDYNLSNIARLDLKNKTFKYVENTTGRYILEFPKEKHKELFGFIYIINVVLYDRKKQKISIKAKNIRFSDNIFTYFRRDVLFLISGGSGYDLFKVKGAGGYGKLLKLIKFK